MTPTQRVTGLRPGAGQETEGVVHEDQRAVPPHGPNATGASRGPIAVEHVRDELDAHADAVDDEELLEVPEQQEVIVRADSIGHGRRLVGVVAHQTRRIAGLE